MEKELELIREQQRTSWNKFSPGWKKWDDLFMHFLRPMADEIIELAGNSDSSVLAHAYCSKVAIFRMANREYHDRFK